MMRAISRIVVGYPRAVVIVALLLTIALWAHIPYLRLGTDLTDMFGRNDPQWAAVSKMGRELGYGNQLFVLVEAPDENAMEAAADRLTAAMSQNDLFRYARSGVSNAEMLNMARFFAWNFPFFLQPGQWKDAANL